MAPVGQIGRRTQDRVIHLLRNNLGYELPLGGVTIVEAEDFTRADARRREAADLGVRRIRVGGTKYRAYSQS